MKDLMTLTEKKNSFTLFIAPTGWGKTTLLMDIYKNSNRKIIYFSPLRALAEEFTKRLKEITTPLFPSQRSTFPKTFKRYNQLKKSFMVSTPEVFDLNYIELLSDDDLIVFDEIHLFFYWGESFRPYLWEFLMAFSNTKIPILSLTATFHSDLLEQWKSHFLFSNDRLLLIDLGNQNISPKLDKIHFFFPFQKKSFNRVFIRKLFLKRTRPLLYFCQFRYEVERWLEFCQGNKIKALGCVGGGALEFIKDLERMPDPKVIFATSTLSHGVNLPDPEMIFINYRVKNKDFWIQMLGRGGRRGNSFELYTFDDYQTSMLQKIIQLLRGLLSI